MFPPAPQIFGGIRSRLTAPVDGASLAVFRMAFGLLILYEAIANVRRGWITEFWVNPLVRFSYLGFDWVKPLPEAWLVGLNYLMAAAAVLLVLGLFYRAAAITVFIIFTYQFLLEATRYLNHFYAICLFAFLLCFIPAANVWSLDNVLKRSGPTLVPTWSVWILRFQVGVLYVFGGLAKLQSDWIAGQPIVSWMGRRADQPLVKFFLDRGWEVPFFAWGGLAIDLLVVPALLWRPTRYYAFAMAVIFHLLNAYLFNIGIFPWMMIGLTTIFFIAEWPRKLVPAFMRRGDPHAAGSTQLSFALRGAAFGILSAFVVLQLLWPARAALYPGNVLWTEEAANFSWRMMLREKKGEARMIVVADQKVDTVQFDDMLRVWQVQPVATRPFLTLQFAHFLADHYRRQGYADVKVYADSWMAMNGRPRQQMIDPRIDLAAEPKSALPARWILPLGADRVHASITASEMKLPPDG